MSVVDSDFFSLSHFVASVLFGVNLQQIVAVFLPSEQSRLA